MAALKALVFLSCLSLNSILVLDCSFQYSDEKAYICLNANIEVTQKEMSIQNVSGVHLKDKGNVDVTQLYFVGHKLSFIPRNWTTFFPNLHRLDIFGNNIVYSQSVKIENLSHFDDTW